MTTPLVDRMLPRIDKTPGYGPKGECWRWTGYHKKGRPVIGGPRGTGLVYVYRASYEYFIGQIPEGLEIDHLCRFPACVNPAHLEPVTHKVNCQRLWMKSHCVRGHPRTPDNLRGRGCLQCQPYYSEARRQRQRAAAG